MDERGRLKAPPYWLYGFRTPSGTKELIWFEEDDLVAKREITLSRSQTYERIRVSADAFCPSERDLSIADGSKAIDILIPIAETTS